MELVATITIVFIAIIVAAATESITKAAMLSIIIIITIIAIIAKLTRAITIAGTSVAFRTITTNVKTIAIIKIIKKLCLPIPTVFIPFKVGMYRKFIIVVVIITIIVAQIIARKIKVTARMFIIAMVITVNTRLLQEPTTITKITAIIFIIIAIIKATVVAITVVIFAIAEPAITIMLITKAVAIGVARTIATEEGARVAVAKARLETVIVMAIGQAVTSLCSRLSNLFILDLQ